MMSVGVKERLAALRATQRAVGQFDRRPFQQILAVMLEAAPTPENLAAFAQRYPDKWAQAVTMFAALAGYEKGQVSLNFFNVGAMSDVQLLAQLAAGDEALRQLGLKRAAVVIDNPPQAALPEGAMPNPLGAIADSAQDVGQPDMSQAPGPSAPRVERDGHGDIVDPAGAV